MLEKKAFHFLLSNTGRGTRLNEIAAAPVEGVYGPFCVFQSNPLVIKSMRV
jgi:hypothetical protein